MLVSRDLVPLASASLEQSLTTRVDKSLNPTFGGMTSWDNEHQSSFGRSQRVYCEISPSCHVLSPRVVLVPVHTSATWLLTILLHPVEMNNTQFRRLVLDTPGSATRKDGDVPGTTSRGGTTPALGSRMRSSIPMTPYVHSNPHCISR